MARSRRRREVLQRVLSWVVGVGREALGAADRIAVERKGGVVHGMRWERQSLRQWLDSDGLRHQLSLSGPQSLNCLRLERAGDGWIVVLNATTGWLAPQRVPVPAGVLVDAAAEEAHH